LNLIDTLHVIFLRSFAGALACEGALFVVDASQGVGRRLRMRFLSRHNLTIVPVINKIDLPAARPITKEQSKCAGDSGDEAQLISARAESASTKC
jgi:GTP-binding protein LepA